MKPIFSDENRAEAVKTFIIARINKQAKITSYSRLVPYLEKGGIGLLFKLEMSGRKSIPDAYGNIREWSHFFDESDAERYFEWLVATISGTKESSDEIMKKANDQLFRILDILGDHIQFTKAVQLVAPYDWQALFTSFDERLTEMKNIIDQGDKSIIDVLNPILEFMKKNTKLLESLQKENEELFGKGA